MNNAFGRFLAIIMLVWTTTSLAQTELGGVINDGGNVTNFGITDGSNNERLYQSFTGITAVINKVVVSVAKTGTPSDNVVVEIRQSSPGGTLLASGSIPGTSISGVGPKYTVDLASFTVSSGYGYYVVLIRSGASDPKNFYVWARGSSASSFGIGFDPSGPGFMKTGGGWEGMSFRNSFIVSLVGSPVPMGQATAVPASLDFGNVNTGQTAQLTLKIKNTGNAVLVLNSLVSSNSVFTISPAIPPSVNVNVGDSSSVTVSFAPTATGTASGQITLNHNGANSAVVIPVTGNGVTSGGSSGGGSGGGSVVTGPMSFSSTSLNVGSANVGASATSTMYLRNPSSSVVAVGLATTNSEFGISPVSGSVPANDSLLVTVTFTPSSGGSKTATLVASYGSSNASSVLNGTAVGATSPVPVLSVPNTTYVADSTVVRNNTGFTVPLKNDGQSNLFVTNMYIGGSSTAFTLSGPSAVTIGPGETYNVSVIFSPQIVGVRTAILNINHNGQGGSTSVFLSGVGKEAPPQAKPTINITASTLSGSPPYMVFFRNNNTGGPVTRTEWQVIRLRDDMRGISSSLSFKVFEGYRDTLTYMFTDVGAYRIELDLDGPGGADHQAFKDTLWITQKDAKIVTSQEVVAFPSVEVGKGSSTSKVSVSNVGDVGTSIIMYKVTGLDSTDFRVITDTFSISPNSTKDIWFEFKPVRTIGDKQTWVDIYFVGPGSPVRVKLSSTATDPPWGPASIIDYSTNVQQGIDSLAAQFRYRLEGLRYSSLVMYFGDGDSSTVFDPIHTYRSVGEYSPSLVVTLANGEKVTPKTREKYIKVIRLPPSPDFTGDKKVDFADFFLLAEQTSKVEHTQQELARFDLSGDSLIDSNDFFIFADYFGKTVP